ncbi:MAG: AbrB/MazE/SpoVT family DNA-binding domain-containing protein [Desulfurococcales archaeon]|nr:AbrB/MazE/SpoVT family DNA-binding domain-containing protein [Desulfurococcales archaeon]
MRIILKVRKKGIIILPKKLREALGVEEGSEVIASVVGDKAVLRALKPKIVDIDPDIVDKLLHEEYELEKGRFTRIVRDEKVST